MVPWPGEFSAVAYEASFMGGRGSGQTRKPYLRTRSKPNTPVYIPPWMSSLSTNSGVTTKIARPAQAKRGYEVMTDTVTPNFQTLQKAGEFVANPMAYTAVSMEVSCGSYQIQEYAYCGANTWYAISNVTGCCCADLRKNWSLPPAIVDKPVLDLNGDLALAKAYAEARGSMAQLLVEAAEMEKTLLMLAKLHNELVLAVDKVRTLSYQEMEFERTSRGRKVLIRKTHGNTKSVFRRVKGGSLFRRGVINRKGKSLPSMAADRWMEWRYGVQPLVYSIQDTAEALAALMTKVLRTSGTGIDADSQLSSARSSGSFPLANVANRASISEDLTVKAEGKVRARVILEARLSISHVLGLDMLSVPSSMWDLVPLSWMVDWVLDIGDWLRGIVPLPGESLRMRSLTYKTKTVETRTFRGYATTGSGSGSGCTFSTIFSGVQAQDRDTTETKTRLVNDQVAMPILPPYVGFRKAARNLIHVLDTVAVVYQSLR